MRMYEALSRKPRELSELSNALHPRAMTFYSAREVELEFAYTRSTRPRSSQLHSFPDTTVVVISFNNYNIIIFCNE